MTFHRSVWVLVGPLVAAGCGGGSSSLRAGASVESVATAPQLLNAEELVEAIDRAYPPDLLGDGISGTVRLRLLVNRDGVPVEVRVLQTSGYRQFDEAATRVADVMRFSPAIDTDGRPTQVWAAFPISFRAP